MCVTVFCSWILRSLMVTDIFSNMAWQITDLDVSGPANDKLPHVVSFSMTGSATEKALTRGCHILNFGER